MITSSSYITSGKFWLSEILGSDYNDDDGAELGSSLGLYNGMDNGDDDSAYNGGVDEGSNNGADDNISLGSSLGADDGLGKGSNDSSDEGSDAVQVTVLRSRDKHIEDAWNSLSKEIGGDNGLQTKSSGEPEELLLDTLPHFVAEQCQQYNLQPSNAQELGPSPQPSPRSAWQWPEKEESAHPIWRHPYANNSAS